MKRAGLVAALIFLAPGPAANAAAPINFCPGHVDSKTCVTCVDKECRIGNAQGDGRTGVFAVDFPVGATPGKQVRVEFGEANVLFGIEDDPDAYSAIAGSARHSEDDGPLGCHVNVFRLPRFVPPPDAPAALAQLTRKTGILERRTTLRLGPYTALDTIAKDDKDGTFELTRSAVYQNVFVAKSCGFRARPDFTSKRWNAIKITIPPLKVTL